MFCSQVLCAVGYVFVDNLVFETKGLALQDIEGVMLTKEAQWSGRELASEDGDAYGQIDDEEDAKEESGMGSGFWWTEVGEKVSFFLILVWAIRLTSCFVYRWRRCSETSGGRWMSSRLLRSRRKRRRPSRTTTRRSMSMSSSVHCL